MLFLIVWLIGALFGSYQLLFASTDPKLSWLALLFVPVALAILLRLLPDFLRFIRRELRPSYTFQASNDVLTVTDGYGRQRSFPWDTIRGVSLVRQFIRTHALVIHASRDFYFGCLFSDTERSEICDWIRTHAPTERRRNT